MTEARWFVPSVGVAVLLAIGGGAALAGAWRMSFADGAGIAAGAAARGAAVPRDSGEVVPADPATIGARNLFRADRRPPRRPYELESSSTTDTPRGALPALTLVGVTLGAPRAALLRGLPGIEGARVLAVGDTADGITLVRVERDRAVLLVGADTLTLTLPEERR